MPEQFSLNMLGGFSVNNDARPLPLPPSSQRVVALIALKRRAVHRLWVLSTLWPYSAPEKAAASLRSALWRLRPLGAGPLVQIEPQYLTLDAGVWVDWYAASDLIGELLRDSAAPDPAHIAELLPLLRAGELLDGWKDQWCTAERDRYRSLRAAALDLLTPRCEKQVAHYPCGSFRSSHTLGSLRKPDNDDSSEQ